MNLQIMIERLCLYSDRKVGGGLKISSWIYIFLTGFASTQNHSADVSRISILVYNLITIVNNLQLTVLMIDRFKHKTPV